MIFKSHTVTDETKELSKFHLLLLLAPEQLHIIKLLALTSLQFKGKIFNLLSVWLMVPALAI